MTQVHDDRSLCAACNTYSSDYHQPHCPKHPAKYPARVAELEQQVAELQRQLVQQDQRFERGASDRVESRMLSLVHHLSPLEIYRAANPDQYIHDLTLELTREVLCAAKSWIACLWPRRLAHRRRCRKWRTMSDAKPYGIEQHMSLLGGARLLATRDTYDWPQLVRACDWTAMQDDTQISCGGNPTADRLPTCPACAVLYDAALEGRLP